MSAAVLTASAASAAGTEAGPLSFTSARVTLDGTTNMHGYTASSTTVRVTGLELAGTPGGDVLEYVLQPGAVRALDVVIPAASLSSPKDGVDKNMHKALKVQEHPDIRFRLRTLEAAGGAYRGVGALTIAGVEKDVTLNLQAERKGNALTVTGTTDLLMTDFGVVPPKAMLGMLKTNPGIKIRIELTLAPAASE